MSDCYDRSMRTLVVLVGGSLFGACVIALAACGTKPLPFAELEPIDAMTTRTDARSGSDGAGPNGESTTCYDPKPTPAHQKCECEVSVAGGFLTATLPCGYGLCLSSTNDEQICIEYQKVIRVPGCPGLEAGPDGGDGFQLPFCDAGVRGETDADADADASADAQADADADADAGGG